MLTDYPIADLPAARPKIQLRPGAHKRAIHGHPWIYSNEVVMDTTAKALPAGSLVTVVTASGQSLGVWIFNSKPLISLRLLDPHFDTLIDHHFLEQRFSQAVALRTRLFNRPFYRLIHAEADGLPGLIIDRYDQVVVVQQNTAGMDRLHPLLLEALHATLKPQTIVLRNDSSARLLEGLPQHEVEVIGATLPDALPMEENQAHFFADPITGQKTGWFFDQRSNRAALAALAENTSLIDYYGYGGGFSVLALVHGAKRAILVDRSEAALSLAAKAAEANNVAARFTPHRNDAFADMESRATQNETYDIVNADPPAFAKTRKDLPTALRGYRKLARLTSALVAQNGLLHIASCSYHVELSDLINAVAAGIGDAKRHGRILRIGGAGPDHPIHPFLPESAYLKSLLLQID
ncbi:MAG: class I SAM-dependent rRNA methyltransferase [Alphaproteobacteria bacterium]